MAGSASTAGVERGFYNFDHQHQDLVLAFDYNFYGNRIVSASADLTLKVFHRRDDTWTLLDSWRAHDAEIVGVKWCGPLKGELLGSIGEDGKFKLWQEDVTGNALSGQRFRQIFWHYSLTRMPFMSLDFKDIDTETYLGLVTRDGYLMVCEPVDHDDATEWRSIFSGYLPPGPTNAIPPLRHNEASFRLAFHREKLPCHTALAAGLDRRSLSLVVGAMDSISIFRTDRERRLYLAARLPQSPVLVRDVSWANGSMRGYDLLASASKDGVVRVYELRTVGDASTASNGREDGLGGGRHHPIGDASLGREGGRAVTSPSPSAFGDDTPRHFSSGISSGLAGVAGSDGTTVTDAAGSRGDAIDGALDSISRPGQVRQEAKLVAELRHTYGAVWRVGFSPSGDALISTGDDGRAHVWRKALQDRWMEFAEMDVANNSGD